MVILFQGKNIIAKKFRGAKLLSSWLLDSRAGAQGQRGRSKHLDIDPKAMPHPAYADTQKWAPPTLRADPKVQPADTLP